MRQKLLILTCLAVLVIAAVGFQQQNFPPPGPLLYQENQGAGVTTNSASSVDTAMFTGYTLPGGLLTAGHRLIVHVCFAHTTGATSTVFRFSFGGAVTGLIAAGTGNGKICSVVNVYATSNTQQYVMIEPSITSTGTLQVPQGPTSYTATLTSSNVINAMQNAAGTSDVYTAYEMTVDLD